MTEMTYNDLRAWASDNNIDVSASPSKDELVEAYENHDENGVNPDERTRHGRIRE